MPAVCFTKPGTIYLSELLSFEDAPAWYDENTEVPEEAIRLLIELEGDPRRLGLNLSPSNLNKDTTCLRQVLIKKFFPYAIDGTAEWQATEGTIWHKAFDAIVPKQEDRWHREVLLPDDLLDAMGPEKWASARRDGHVKLFQYTPHHASWEIEIFPGIWINGRTDKIAKDLSEIQDFKTKAWGGWKDRKTGSHKIRHFPPDRGAVVQLAAYARMVEVLTGTYPEKLTIRQMYRGSRIAKESWKKYELEPMSNDELEATIRPHVEQFLTHAHAMKDIKDIEEAKGNEPYQPLFDYLDNVELSGERMFRGDKCPLYCTQMPICFAQAGRVRFESRADDVRIVRPGELK